MEMVGSLCGHWGIAPADTFPSTSPGFPEATGFMFSWGHSLHCTVPGGGQTTDSPVSVALGAQGFAAGLARPR